MSTAAMWNPYYVAFARSKGLAPEAVPRGAVSNVEFMGWIGRQWEAWARECGHHSADEARLRTRDAAAAFGAWLARAWPTAAQSEAS